MSEKASSTNSLFAPDSIEASALLRQVRETGNFSTWEQYNALMDFVLPDSTNVLIWGVGSAKEITVDRSGTIAFDGMIEVRGNTLLKHPDHTDSDPQTIRLVCRKLKFTGVTHAIQTLGPLEVHVSDWVAGDIVFECTNGLRDHTPATDGSAGTAGNDQNRAAKAGANGKHAVLGSHGSTRGGQGKEGAHGGDVIYDNLLIDGQHGDDGHQGRDITMFARRAENFAIISLLSPGGEGQDGGDGAEGGRGGNGQSGGVGGKGGDGTPLQSASRGGNGGPGGNGGKGAPGGNGGNAGNGGDSGNLTFTYDIAMHADPQNDPGTAGSVGRGRRGGRGGQGGNGGKGGKGGEGSFLGDDRPNGGNGYDGQDGPNGRDGVDGLPGRDGRRGVRAVFRRIKVPPSMAVRHLISFGDEKFVKDISTLLNLEFLGPVFLSGKGDE